MRKIFLLNSCVSSCRGRYTPGKQCCPVYAPISVVKSGDFVKDFVKVKDFAECCMEFSKNSSIFLKQAFDKGMWRYSQAPFLLC